MVAGESDEWLMSSVGPVLSRMGHKGNPDNANLEGFSLPSSSQHTGFMFLFEALLGCGFMIQIINQMKGSKLHVFKLMKCTKFSMH